MLKSFNLTKKLTLTAFFSILIGIVIVGYVGFLETKKNIEQQTEATVKNAVLVYNESISDWLKHKDSTMSSMPKNASSLFINDLLKVMKASGDFENVFLAYPDGTQNNADKVVLPPDNNDPRVWGWYVNASKQDNIYMAEPSIAAATGDQVVSLGKAIQLNGQKVIVGSDIKMEHFLEQLTHVNLPGEGELFVTTKTNKVFANKNVSLINENISKLGLDKNLVSGALNKINISKINDESFHLYAKEIPNTDLITMVKIKSDSLMDGIIDTALHQLIVSLIVIITISLLTYILISRLLKPLSEVSSALNNISKGDGDLTQKLDIKSNDEIGQLSQSFNDFLSNQRDLITQIKDQAVTLKAFADKSMIMTSESREIINTQQTEIDMIATAINEMNSSTGEIARNAEEAARSAHTSFEQAAKGTEIVANSIESISDLSDEISETTNVVETLNVHVKEINNILVAIQDIANQTNLLALNAAIEAARAGESGRGFAVVADEVRNLSIKTHKSTEEIQGTIHTFEEVVSKATQLMNSSSEKAKETVHHSEELSIAFSEINGSIQLISDMSAQIATAVEEQSAVTNEISENISKIKDVSDNLVVSSDITEENANGLNAEAESLSDKVARFKL